MIVITRKREQNSAYTTQGEARPGYPARASTLIRVRQDPSTPPPHDLNPPKVCVCKEVPD
jgi:hypothetical protein